MEQTALQALAELLHYLQKKGTEISLKFPDAAPVSCREALETFLAPPDAECLWLPLPDEDGAAVGVCDPADAPLLPALGALFTRALTESREFGDERDLYRRSLQFIKEHYMEGITVADIARAVGYSSSYFGYIFKKKHGIPVNRYVQQLQLAKAKDLLIGTTFSVSMVAEYVGCEDANYFSQLFKKQFGLSPKQYRAAHDHLA